MIQKIKNLITAEMYALKLMFKANKLSAIIYLVLTSIIQILPLINIWLWKLILDELTNIYKLQTYSNYIWIILGTYLFLQVMNSILQNVLILIKDKLLRKIALFLDLQTMEKTTMIDISFFDDPNNRDLLESALNSESFIVDAVPWIIDVVIQMIVFVITLISFLSYHFLIGALFILTYIPGAIISYRHQLKMDQWSITNIPQYREKNYYKSLLTERFAAKDLRLYNLADYFKNKYNNLWKIIRKEQTLLFKQGMIFSLFASLLTYSGIFMIIVFSVLSVMYGTMLIGSLSLYIGLGQTAGSGFKQIIEALSCQMEISVPHIIKYIDFIHFKNINQSSSRIKLQSCPEIEFRNVFFKYPNCEDWVLNNLNFKICKGKKVAIVGVNGAGKSTIIKLLLRFYKPTLGKILINGKCIELYSLEELHDIFSVCFQETTVYSLTFKENIAISDIDRINDIGALESAMQASGADKICEILPFGLDTDMTRQFNDEGAELSGGQWQKVSLARTFFKRSKFVILDEPSSALDPEAEDNIFSSFKRLCRNKGGILISHRLSSIMMVDEIILIDKGAVIENGTHDELIKRNGQYAELYRMQAEKYIRKR